MFDKVIDLVKGWVAPPMEAPKPVAFPVLAQPLDDWYHASYVSVEDGDTINVVAKLGLGVLKDVTIRLYGVAVDEDENIDGQIAEGYVSQWLRDAILASVDAFELVIFWVKHDKYGGRDNCVVFRKSDGACLNLDLITKGYGVPTDRYGRKI